MAKWTYRWEIYEARDGWRIRLCCANGRTMTQAEAYSSRAGAVRAIRGIQRGAVAAEIVEVDR